MLYTICSNGVRPTLRKKGVGCVEKAPPALATSLTATVVPCARAVCCSAPTSIRLAVEHNQWHFLLGRATSRY